MDFPLLRHSDLDTSFTIYGLDEYNNKVDKYNQALENGENPDDDF